MTLDFDKGEGSYFYNRIGEPISLTINQLRNSEGAFTLHEKEGTFYLYAYSTNTIHGFWKSDNEAKEGSSLLEVSLQREGASEENIPQISAKTKALQGIWYGENNKFREVANIWIYPISDTQIYYEGTSVVWGHNGVINGVAELKEEEQALFNKLVQGYYHKFIYYTNEVNYEEVWLNETEKAWGGPSYARAEAPAMCYYVKANDKMYVAIRGDHVNDDHIQYFTNDGAYKSQPPKTMAEWASCYDVEIDYHYVP